MHLSAGEAARDRELNGKGIRSARALTRRLTSGVRAAQQSLETEKPCLRLLVQRFFAGREALVLVDGLEKVEHQASLSGGQAIPLMVYSSNACATSLM